MSCSRQLILRDHMSAHICKSFRGHHPTLKIKKKDCQTEGQSGREVKLQNKLPLSYPKRPGTYRDTGLGK